MKNQFTFRLLIAIFTIVLIGVVGCAPAPTQLPLLPTPTRDTPNAPSTPSPEPTPDARVQLQFWHALSHPAALASLIEQFNAGNPDIFVSVHPHNSSITLIENVRAANSSAATPHLVIAHPTDLARLAQAGALVPLDEPSMLSVEELREFFPAFVDRYPQSGNRVNSIGWGRHLQVLYYNLDLLKSVGISRVPETWEDFQRACAALSKTTDVLCLEMDANSLDFQAAILSRGGGLLSGDGRRVMFDQKPGTDALQFIADLVKNKSAALTTRAFQKQTNFAAGRVAFAFDTTLALSAYDKQVKTAGKNFEWGIALPPRGNVSILMAYGPSIAILKTTPQKQQAALTLLRWMLTNEPSSNWAIASQSFPPRASVRDNLAEFIKANPRYGQAYSWLRLARAEPSIAAWAQVRVFIAEAMIAAAGGKTAPADALRDAASKANAVLGQ